MNSRAQQSIAINVMVLVVLGWCTHLQAESTDQPIKLRNQVHNPVTGDTLAESGRWIYLRQKGDENWKRLIPGRVPQWLPDGKRFYYFLDVGYDFRAQLWSADKSGESRLRMSTSDYFIDRPPIVSKDGKKLAWHFSACGAANYVEEIKVVNLRILDGPAEEKVVLRCPDSTNIGSMEWDKGNWLSVVVNGQVQKIDTTKKQKEYLSDFCAKNQIGEKKTKLEGLFIDARGHTGQIYAEARDRLLAEDAAAIELLERKVSAEASEQERWLAEIMLARAKEPNAFKGLEQSFHKRVLVAKYADPYILSKRRIMYPARGRPLLLPNEVPRQLKKEYLEKLEKGHGKNRAKEEKQFYEFLRISDSSLWKPLVSEILLKGWTAPASSLWQPPRQRSGREDKYRPLTITGPLGTLRTSDIVLNEGDYVYQAIVLAGKLGEERAGGRVLEILRKYSIELPPPDTAVPTAEFFDCREAVKTLGKLRYKEALDMLLDLAKDEKTPIGIRQVVLPSIGHIGDEPNKITIREVFD